MNTELNDLKMIIYYRKFEVPVERVSVCNVTKKLKKCMSCSDTNDVIDLLPYEVGVHINVKLMSWRCHSARVFVIA